MLTTSYQYVVNICDLKNFKIVKRLEIRANLYASIWIESKKKALVAGVDSKKVVLLDLRDK